MAAQSQNGRKARSSDRKAFTLVELLVVIGIIALLISILLPSLAKARQAANTVVCASNMRQIGLMMHMYANDHGGKLPMGTIIVQQYPQWTIDWSDQLASYVGKTFVDIDELGWVWNNDAPAFRCPEDNQLPARSGYGFRKTYAMNVCTSRSSPLELWGMTEIARMDLPGYASATVFDGALIPYWAVEPRYHKMTEAKDSAGTILLAEMVDERNVMGWGQNTRTGTVEYAGQQVQNLATPLHSGKFNYLMCDGHVELLNMYQTVGTGIVPYPGPSKGMWTRQTDD